MYCKHCGCEIKGKAVYCPECGGEIKKKTEGNYNIPSRQNFKYDGGTSRKRKIMAIVAMCIIVIGIGTLIFGGRSYKKVIDIYIKAMFSGKKNSVEKIYKLLPEEAQDAELQYYMEEYSGGKEEMLEEAQNEFKEDYDKIEDTYGKGWRYSYKIIQEEEATRKEIREWKENITDSDKVDVEFNREIKEMKYVTAEITT